MSPMSDCLARDHLRLDLVDLKLRQARRFALDELLVERGELLEVGQVPEVDDHLGEVLGDGDEAEGRVRVAAGGEAEEG